MIPLGAMPFVSTPEQLPYETVDAGYLTAVMKDAGNALNIVILDACRDNPFKSFSKSLHQGLTAMPRAEGMLIAYATAPGTVAYDGTGRNSPYTKHLLRLMQEPNLPLEILLRRVRTAVKEETLGKQQPWYEASIDGDFCFDACENFSVQSPAPISLDVTIPSLLATCERHFQADRLTTGVGGTALACYEEVLQHDPTNTDALTGLQKIEQKYVAWAQQALTRGDIQKATQYLAGLRRVNPESSALRELEYQMSPPSQPIIIPQSPLIESVTLFVDTVPATASVRILNIQPQYYDGIELEPGRYHIEVSARGYSTVQNWIDLESGSYHFQITLPKEVNSEPIESGETILPAGMFSGCSTKYPIRLYNSPSDSYASIDVMKGAGISVLAMQGDWLNVRTANNATGWIRKTQITFENCDPDRQISVSSQSSISTNSSTSIASTTNRMVCSNRYAVRLYTNISDKYASIDVSAGQRISLLAEQGEWYQIRAGSRMGWLRKTQISLVDCEKDALPVTSSRTQNATLLSDEDSSGCVSNRFAIRLYVNISDKYASIDVLAGQHITILSEKDEWYQVRAGNLSGWIRKTQITFTDCE